MGQLTLLGAGKPPAASAFVPSSLFGAGEKGGWWDGSDTAILFQNSNGTTAVTTAGDPVGYWGDKSGNAQHITQATAGKRPTYQTTGLRHDGSDDHMFRILSAAITATTVDIYVVFKPIVNTASGIVAALTIADDGVVTSDNGMKFSRQSATEFATLKAFSNTTNQTFNTGTAYLIEARFDGANFNQTVTVTGSSTTTGNVANTAAFNASYVHVGGNAIGFGGGVLNADIAEMVLIDRNLTGTERTNLRNNLVTKWSL